jgi:hypothetical protein
MNNSSLEIIRNFSTNPQVINKINEMMEERIKYYKLRDPEDVDNVENSVYRDTVDVLSSFRRYNRPDDEIIDRLQEDINYYHEMIPQLGNQGGNGLKRKNKKSRKSNKKSRKSNKKSRKSNKKSRKR